MKYKHYSFDLWGTLIKGNPEFKAGRVMWFYFYMNPKKLEPETITAIFREIDVMCNNVNEVCGGNITSEEMYAMALYKMGNEGIIQEQLTDIYISMERLFLDHPPTIIDGVVDTLTSLREKGKTLSILSNTGFIKGVTVKKFLDTTPLRDMFDFYIFSDQFQRSKPNPEIFNSILTLSLFMVEQVVEKEDILHVGDNPLADVKGAQDYGIDALLISNSLTNKTIKDVLTYNGVQEVLS